jgi:hypothetical protein
LHGGGHGTVGFIPHQRKGCWLIVSFGECQLTASAVFPTSPFKFIKADFSDT